MTTNSAGYFFVINEVVYPVYTTPSYTDDLTIEESWSCLCDSLLNPAYGKVFNDLLDFIPRGAVTSEGEVVCSDLSTYLLTQVKDLFHLADEFVIQPGYPATTSPEPEQSLRLRHLYLPTNYLYTLPWHVLQVLSSSATNESKKVQAHMWTSRMGMVRKRLGAFASMPQLQ